MQTAALAVVSGLLYGCTLLLVAIGLTLIFGVGRVVNFAHGTLYALGAFLGASIYAVAGLWVACLVAPALVAVVAVVLDLLVIRRLRRRGEMVVLLFTFGLGIVIDAAITGLWGARSYAVPVPSLLAGGVSLFGGQISVYSIVLAASSLVVTGLLVAALHGTAFGLRLRAAAENPAMAEIAGVDVDFAFTAVLAVGSAFAALAGVLVLPMIGASNGMDLSVTTMNTSTVIVGGLGSLPGTALASLLVGVILTLGATYASSAAYLLLFAAVIGMLLVRPFGLVPSRSE
jgi:branched-chain amino acid transport system permease protein